MLESRISTDASSINQQDRSGYVTVGALYRFGCEKATLLAIYGLLLLKQCIEWNASYCEFSSYGFSYPFFGVATSFQLFFFF